VTQHEISPFQEAYGGQESKKMTGLLSYMAVFSWLTGRGQGNWLLILTYLPAYNLHLLGNTIPQN
jgi:hypothetical protein